MDAALHWSFPLFLATSSALALWPQTCDQIRTVDGEYFCLSLENDSHADSYIEHKCTWTLPKSWVLHIWDCASECSLRKNQGTDNKRLLKLLTQENVLVGGFFSISGYVAAYTTTNLRERSHDPKKFKEPELFFWQKVPWQSRNGTCGS